MPGQKQNTSPGCHMSQVIQTVKLDHEANREKDHRSNNTILDLPDDPPTRALFEIIKHTFMKEQP